MNNRKKDEMAKMLLNNVKARSKEQFKFAQIFPGAEGVSVGVAAGNGSAATKLSHEQHQSNKKIHEKQDGSRIIEEVTQSVKFTVEGMGPIQLTAKAPDAELRPYKLTPLSLSERTPQAVEYTDTGRAIEYPGYSNESPAARTTPVARRRLPGIEALPPRHLEESAEDQLQMTNAKLESSLIRSGELQTRVNELMQEKRQLEAEVEKKNKEIQRNKIIISGSEEEMQKTIDEQKVLAQSVRDVDDKINELVRVILRSFHEEDDLEFPYNFIRIHDDKPLVEEDDRLYPLYNGFVKTAQLLGSKIADNKCLKVQVGTHARILKEMQAKHELEMAKMKEDHDLEMAKMLSYAGSETEMWKKEYYILQQELADVKAAQLAIDEDNVKEAQITTLVMQNGIHLRKIHELKQTIASLTETNDLFSEKIAHYEQNLFSSASEFHDAKDGSGSDAGPGDDSFIP